MSEHGETLFVVTYADIAALPSYEFDTLWKALGIIVRARAKAVKLPAGESKEREEPPVAVRAQDDAIDPPVERETGEEPPAVAVPSRVEDAPSRVDRGANDPLIERSIEPQTPDERDERMFTAIRAGEADSYAAIDRVVGLTSSTAYQRFDLLERYGTLPADMVEWRRSRRGKVGNRGKPKANHPWKTPQKTPFVVVSDDETFEERRVRMAREAAERTWAARHAGTSA